MSHHSNLVDHWLALPSPDLAVLRRHGIPYKAAQLVGGVRRGRNGRMLVPVWDDPPSIYRSVDDPVLLAIIAIDPAQPDRWDIVAGDDHTAILGECVLREAVWYSEPLPVFRNPLSWLRSGGAGVCPLAWQRFAQEMLWHPEIELVAEDIETGDALKRAIDKAARIRKPRVSVELQEAA